MRRLRAVLVTAPPLLADLIRHVLTGRAALTIVAELTDAATADAQLGTLSPDVVIIGPGGVPPVDPARVRATLPGARVLVLSEDLTQLRGPGDDDIDAFTPDTLAARLMP